MEEKKCAMCGQVKKLCESHIIPKFFGNYIKKKFSNWLSQKSK